MKDEGETKTVLWIQNETATTPETLLLNGESCTEANNDSVFKWLTSDWYKSKGWRLFPGWDRWKSNEKREISPNLTFMNKKENAIHYLLIQACVIETDEHGRKMPYIFCAPKSQIDIFFDKLKNIIEKQERTINEKDKESIKQFLEENKKKEKRKLIIISLILIILFLIILIKIFISL